MSKTMQMTPDWHKEAVSTLEPQSVTAPYQRFAVNPYGNGAQQELLASSTSGPKVEGGEAQKQDDGEQCWWRLTTGKGPPIWFGSSTWTPSPIDRKECEQENQKADGDNPYEPKGGVYWGVDPNR